MDKRIFVRKRSGYNQEEIKLKETLNQLFSLDFCEVSLYNVYDIYNVSEKMFETIKRSVFSEIMVDEVVESLVLESQRYIAFENLPAQFDQRADSAMQCIQLLDSRSEIFVRSGRLVIFDKQLTAEQLERLKKYLINPIEMQEKDMTKLSFEITTTPKPLKTLTTFNDATVEELHVLKQELSLALTIEDLVFIQNYFKSEKRQPTETEIMVLDCYWSDHCRHTTFETVLDEVNITSNLFQVEMQQAYDTYLMMRETLNSSKPITLMDMASIVGKYHRQILNDTVIEVSEEINACSFYADITVTDYNGNEKIEKWLIQFKNETHNHPSEIEPFGGASTCIGGAIRDPLSGRSFVYQAMRISGSGNILQNLSETLDNKLPQVVISKGTAHGNSSYGNQIGLATTHVRELYDDSYVAKHMEVGAVVGAVKVGNFKRETPQPDDIVLLIGGRTGRDGIQGASGSSVVHTDNSLMTMSSQVQKGNAPEERKIQRLFRNEAVTKVIKKCNDFGAGGVCVAVGELAPGIEIHLDKVLVKYQGLNATELAISESQERMAVVIHPDDYDFFTQACALENIEYSHVATITDRKRLEMYYFDEKVVDMSAEFLETSGVRQHTVAELVDNTADNPFVHQQFTKESFLKELSSLNVTNQKGLIQQFDASIGATTVLMPFSGKHQLTPTQASVQALPVLNGDSDTATILTYGFIPKISHYSPFISSIYAVLESVAKVYAVGGNKDSLYFSFQEYFEKLGHEAKKWGKVTQSLLGTIYAQQQINRPSIGGKDSMSGTFNHLNVVETLISFACAPVKIKAVITPELKSIGNKLYHVPVVSDNRGYPNVLATMKNYDLVNQFIQSGQIVSAYVQDAGSMASSLVKMSLGNGLGFTVNSPSIFDFTPASLVVEAVSDLPFDYIGEVSEAICINGVSFTTSEIFDAYTHTLNGIYPLYQNEQAVNCENIMISNQQKRYYHEYVDEVRVVIPVFPGTNCEYDSMRAFKKAGATVKTVVIRNKQLDDIEQSIATFVERIKQAHIIFFPGGFSSGDEPDGSAKFIVNVLQNEQVKLAIHEHLAQKKLILGICNGFQALIKSGLVPYGEIKTLDVDDLTLYRNDSYTHISTTALTRVANVSSPWLQDFTLNEVHEVLFSHGEGKLVGKKVEEFKHLTAFQYCDFDGQATMNGKFNPNGSMYAIEGMVSACGLVLGKMGHSERFGENLYKTNTQQNQYQLFENGVNYFKKRG